MKKINRIVCILLAFVLCTAVTFPSSAAALPSLAGIYKVIVGTSCQTENNIDTTTSVTQNPDGAQLTVKVYTLNSNCDEGEYLTRDISNSAPGVTNYSYRSPMMYMYENGPTEYEVHHIVSNGDSYTTYVTKTEGTVDQSYLT